MHRGETARHAKTQPLFLQMSLLEVDSAYEWSIMFMQTAVLWLKQPLNNSIFTVCEYFLRLSLSVTPIQIFSAIKTRPFAEVGRKSPLQLPSQTYFAKIEANKVIVKS